MDWCLDGEVGAAGFPVFGGFDVGGAEFFDQLGHPASGNALQIHFSDGRLEGAIHPRAAFQKRGFKGARAATHLGDLEAEFAQGSRQTAGFEADGVALALLDALVGAGLQVAASLNDHASIHQQFGEAGQAVGEAIFKKEIDAVTGEGIVCVFGHGLVLGTWFAPPFSNRGRTPSILT